MQNNLANKKDIRIIAGPCAIESQDQLEKVFSHIKKLGLSWVRAGAFKPRHSPHSFQGLGNDAINLLVEACEKFELNSISEVVDEQSLDVINDKVDAIQIGTRNMTNYSLLDKIGQVTSKNNKPVLFKRGMSAKLSELLSASDYITQYGNKNLVLCERGIRTFEDSTRFTLDISSVPVLHKQSSYSVCVDVSHAAGNSDLVSSLALAAVAAGADAVMIEVHPDPQNAKCDGAQQLSLRQFEDLFNKIKNLANSIGRQVY